MKLPALPDRDNLIERQSEAWRPPIFRPNATSWDSLLASARRFLDLQASSIWRDLRALLVGCNGSVLDVGCGAQPYRSLLPKSVPYQGIDTADAAAHFGYEVPDTIYFTGDRWPIDSASRDLVLATETLEHVEHSDRFLAEARRVLKPDGCLVLTVPFAARWHYIPHDYWRFTPSGLRTLLTEAGFAVPTVYARGNEITVACYKGMALILMLALGQYRSLFLSIIGRFIGALLLPVLACLAVIGQISLSSRGGNDCLGYTVVAAASSLSKGPVP